MAWRLRLRRTKIVCTIGPASSSPDVLTSLVRAGMDVARLNFSHGAREEHGEVMTRIREIARKLERPVAILQDLAGLKIRIGELATDSVTLQPGASIVLTTREVPGDSEEISVNYPELPRLVERGNPLLLSDGEIELEVEDVSDDDIRCRVVVGGELTPKKGINLPTSTLDVSALTDKDRADLGFGIEHGVDFVALSFVASASDVREARAAISEQGATIPIIAKIERHEALENIDAILGVADGIMVARGDLGVETPLQKIPLIQKKLIKKASWASKTAITATHMLRSMVDNRRPTRAEVTDVANAVLDGSDAVMLSEETAIGKNPVAAVEMMSGIAENAETGFPHSEWLQALAEQGDRTLSESVALAACRLAEDVGASSIVAGTRTGATARFVAKYRPRQTIYAATPEAATFRRLSLVWGVRPLFCPGVDLRNELFVKPLDTVGQAREVAGPVVVIGGSPREPAGSTNTIRIFDDGPSR